MRIVSAHPSEDELFRYADGELTARAAGQVRGHLDACASCRGRASAFEGNLRELAAHHHDVAGQLLPPPPAEWADLRPRMRALDAAADVPPMRRPAPTYRWAMAAAAVLLAAILLYKWRDTPTVQAAELLKKAAAAADSRPAGPRRIQIRTSKLVALRTVAGVRNASDDPALRTVAALFTSSHFDWNDPLSARAYQMWHDGLAERDDRVIQEAGFYTIRTATNTGELAVASLTLHAADLAPERERLEFRNREWVEISSLPVEPVNEIFSKTKPESAASSSNEISSLGSSVPPPGSGATAADELKAISALHALGADLGDPVEVSLSGGQVIVSGVGVSPRRKQEIQQVLGNEPKIALRFANEPFASPLPGTTQATVSTNQDIIEVQDELAKQLGGRANFEQSASQVLDLNESMMARAHALRNLANRFPPETEASLDAADRKALAAIVFDHVSALRRQAAQLDGLIRPAIGTTVASAAGAVNWQAATGPAFDAARGLERSSAVLFGNAAPGATPVRQIPAAMKADLTRLKVALGTYGRTPE